METLKGLYAVAFAAAPYKNKKERRQWPFKVL